MNFDWSRFLRAQDKDYSTALAEIKSGRKQSHWIWYIFPQLTGLGRSSTAAYYGISGSEEAAAYLEQPVLRERLIEIATALLSLETNNAAAVLGTPDDLKMRSSMTLFAIVRPDIPVFQAVLDKFYNGEFDQLTVEALRCNGGYNGDMSEMQT
jgi:uncharacterized protein (DUF1810 family)